ncbi:MAG: cysteine--tRNA ligase [Thermoanaerobaculales bacterium]|jgi:cysteinyl-tRNA synthetase|nr:cysteine--tRNA ligase [Thermoanaerobaculales bacterium]
MTERLRLFNTLTRRLEDFEALDDRVVRIYTCGPTIYDFAHIGNYRTFVFEDVLRRTFQLFGYRVLQVQNLTDVDDRTIQRANQSGVPLREFTDRFAAAFFEDLATLRVEPAEHYPRATDYIPQMVEIIKRLEEGGHTYRSEGSVYYRISTFPGYGKLSGVRPEANLAGARVDVDDYDKEDARDFVLWKAPKEGEPVWDTELGPGRPGWHIECSAMAMALLGETFDIHCGGVDNIFPHHENEIAQSEGATGKAFAHTWLHAEHLVVEGEKMAKRLGNFFTLRDLVERGFDPLAVRYLLLSVPYRQRLNFTFDGLHAAAQAIDRIANTLRRLDSTPEAAGADGLVDGAREFQRDFRDALADDLNTARAVAALHDLLRRVNTALDGGGISAAAAAAVRAGFADADSVLAVFPERRATDADAEIDALIGQRAAARAARDFARADAIRDELAARGIILEDTPHGTVWHRG